MKITLKQRLGILLAGALFSGREHLKDDDEISRLRIKLEQQRSNEIYDPDEFHMACSEGLYSLKLYVTLIVTASCGGTLILYDRLKKELKGGK